MIPQKIDLDAVVTGHTWAGIPTIIRRDRPEGEVAAPPASALALVEMVFRPGADCRNASALTLQSGGEAPAITIVSAVEWEISIPPRILPLTPGRWNWILTTTAADGTRDPLLTGTLTVHPAP